jgi:YVTN family beta-propeller protein
VAVPASGTAVPAVQNVDQSAPRAHLLRPAAVLNRPPHPNVPGPRLDVARVQRLIAPLLLGQRPFHPQLLFNPIPVLPVTHDGRYREAEVSINKRPRLRPATAQSQRRHSTGVGPRKRPAAVNVYAATMTGHLRQSVAHLPERVYVPNSGDGTISVINPATFEVVARYTVGLIPHHITPSWDLTRLYVENEGSSTLTVIDPRTGTATATISVPFPYNLYFTPDGRRAIVVVERLNRLDFRDPHTWRLIKSVSIPWPGVDHLDFSADGRYVLASTEFSGVVVKVDTVALKIAGWVNVGGLPIDVRLAPDGSVFFVANQGRMGVSIIDPVAMKVVGFVPTGAGAHGFTVSRDTRSMYVGNRLSGTISVINIKARRVTATWTVGGSPDMLQLSPNGRQLWVSNRFNGTVVVVDTRTGRVLHTIPVGLWPHGLTYFPNAGRISLGHNGVYR